MITFLTALVDLFISLFLSPLDFRAGRKAVLLRESGPAGKVGYGVATILLFLIPACAIAAAGFIVTAQINGNFNEKVQVVEIVAIGTGAASSGLAWTPVETAVIRARIKPPYSFRAGDSAYITRTRMSGLKFCTDRGCTNMQIVQAPDEIRDAVAAWPFKT